MTLGRKKEIGVLVFLSLYSGLLFGLFALATTQNTGELSILTTVLFVMLALLWVALVQFSQAISFESGGVLWLVVLIVPALIVGVGRASLPALVGAVIAGLLLLVGRSYAKSELSNRIHFKTGQIFRISTRYTLLALAFGLIGIVLPDFQEQLVPEKVQIPAKYLANWVDASAPIVSRFIPGYDPNKTIDEFIAFQVQKQMGAGNSEPIPPGQLIIARRQLADQFGIALAGNESLSAVTGKIVNHYLQSWAKYNQLLFIGIVISLLFLVWRALTPVLLWPTIAILAGLIYFATRIGLVYKVKTPATIERLQL